MADWIRCPHCQLNHSVRADGLCPRCHQSVGGASVAASAPASVPEAAPITPGAAAAPAGLPDLYTPAPQAEGTPGRASLPEIYSPTSQPPATPGTTDRAQASAGEEGLALAVRVAGAFLVVNALVLLIERALLPAQTGALQMNLGSAILDLVLGGMLVAGKPKVLPWVKLRVVLGAVVFTIYYLAMEHDPVLAGFQLAVSGAFVLLLFGQAGAWRLRIASTVFALYLVLEVLGLSGSTLPARMRYAFTGELDGVVTGEVWGKGSAYRLLVPDNGQWFRRSAEAARRDNPDVDLWLIRPQSDAHVITVVEELEPGARLDLDRFSQAVLANAGGNGGEVTVVERRPLRVGAVPGRFIHTSTVAEGLRLEFLYGLYTDGQSAYQVIAFVEEDRFKELGPELQELVTSFAPGGR